MTEVEQAMEKELDVAVQKLAEKEQEIENMRQEVSPVLVIVGMIHS